MEVTKGEAICVGKTVDLGRTNVPVIVMGGRVADDVVKMPLINVVSLATDEEE